MSGKHAHEYSAFQELAADQRGYAPRHRAGPEPERLVTDAEARAMRRALARVDRIDGADFPVDRSALSALLKKRPHHPEATP